MTTDGNASRRSWHKYIVIHRDVYDQPYNEDRPFCYRSNFLLNRGDYVVVRNRWGISAGVVCMRANFSNKQAINGQILCKVPNAKHTFIGGYEAIKCKKNN